MTKKILFSLYAMVIVVMAVATIVCQMHGQDFANANIYLSWWFSALWAVMTAFGVYYFLKRKIRKYSVIALHLAFVLILIGAFVTHITGIQGVLHLRNGETTNRFVSTESTSNGKVLSLPFSVTLKSFDVKYKKGTMDPLDYRSVFVINGEKEGQISMNNIYTIQGYRLYQRGFDDDMEGSYISVNSDPYGIAITYTGYALLALSFIAIMLRNSQRRLFFYSLPLTIFIGYLFSLKDYNIPVLNTWILPIHVSMIVSAYVLLLVSIGVRKMLPIALGLLSMGIFLGAIWANISWGNYWGWDPKEVWALITLMIYAIPVHSATFPAFQSKKFYRTYMIIAFLAVLMTYFGVNLFLSGMHSYA